MATVTTSVEAFDALGNRPSFKAEQDSVSGVLTPHHVIETNGLPVGVSNPLPVADSHSTMIFSGALGIPATCGTATTQIVAAGLAPRWLTIQTAPTSAGNLWLNPTGGAAVVGSGVFVASGGGSFTFPNGVTATVNGISDNGTIAISGIGG
jgi:hypothetical protein